MSVAGCPINWLSGLRSWWILFAIATDEIGCSGRKFERKLLHDCLECTSHCGQAILARGLRSGNRQGVDHSAIADANESTHQRHVRNRQRCSAGVFRLEIAHFDIEYVVACDASLLRCDAAKTLLILQRRDQECLNRVE